MQNQAPPLLDIDGLSAVGIPLSPPNTKESTVRPPTPDSGDSQLPPPPQQQQQQQQQQQLPPTPPRPFLIVPQRIVNGGHDIKFSSDPFNLNLQGLMTPQEFKRMVEDINRELVKCRSTKMDVMLFYSGAAMIPLIPWAIRTKKRKRLRKELMLREVDSFNSSHPDLWMRWECEKGKEKKLMIFRRCDVNV